MKEYTVKVFEDGRKSWLLNGLLHREDGPAIEWADGGKSWYLHGECLTEEEHKRRIAGITMGDALARLIRIMGTFDLATGHADTMNQALDALEGELRDVLGHLRARRDQRESE